jgi:molybdopterin converting factor subunit 1
VIIELLYFAQLKETLGTARETIDVADGRTVDDVVATLRARPAWSSLAALPLACAVNEEMAAGEQVLRDGDRLALLPPLSGG